MPTAFRKQRLRSYVVWSVCLTMIFPPAIFAEGGFFRLVTGGAKTTAVTRLAKRIDHLEQHLDQCGSIVIKTPDVWGESRLMRHRSDVETQLKARLSGFDFRINAIQSTRDAALLASAVALQERIGTGDVPALGGEAPDAGSQVNNATLGLLPNPNDATNTTIVPRSAFLNVSPTTGLQSATLTTNIEPVIELDQLHRYLQHLNELRRLNEGDDNADTPGYALNLIRIPVSVTPGRKTQEGFGAEVQITIDPYMSDEILPLAFKDFVIKGVVDRIGYDVFQIAQRADIKILEQAANPDQMAPPKPAPAQAPSEESATPPLKHSVDPIKSVDRDLGGAGATKPIESNKISKFKENLRSMPTYQIRAFSNALGVTDFERAKTIAGVVTEPDFNLSEPQLDDLKQYLFKLSQRELLGDVNHRDLSIPGSQRVNVNGASLLPIALHAYRCLVSTGASAFSLKNVEDEVPPNHRLDHGLTMPEVDTLLTRETEAAYEFLAQPYAASLWTTFCTPELARRVRENRQNTATDELAPSDDSLAILRRDFFAQIKSENPGADGTVTEALAWQIIVEASLINERLVKDMKETAVLKNCPCVPTEWMPFFEPNPCPEARMAFAEYVKCKWPIHVFALDPVTQDQNIADSFSQRREMQIAMAIAASNRLIGGQAMSRFARRMEYDLETVQLNRTAVAFSHGDNTFGWRFFPRIQAPPVPSNLSAITHDLLIGGQSRDSLARKYKLESGIRECTALVVMPSFVPQVMVDVRTNWFRLAKHVPFYPFGKRKPDYEDSMDLSREVVELRELQTLCVNDAHLYRDGEVYRLCKAVKRLEDRLPLQTHNVSVPWENDLGGFEVFQSGTQVLGPEIHGWYGAPGIKVLNTQLERNLLATIASLSQQLNAINTQIVVARANSRTEEVTNLTAQQAKLTTDIQTAKDAYSSARNFQTSTAVYLVGKNFSVLNCRVIAGGVDVTDSIEVINRNLMQVRIPSTVSTVATNHDPNDQRYVVVHLATPYGATSRLLIPMEGTAEASDAAKVADEATKTAKEAVSAVKKLADRFPVQANWGTDTGRDFTVQGYFEETGFKKYRFCPVAARKTPIFVYQDPKKSPLLTPHPQGTFDEALVGVTGELTVVVEIPESATKMSDKKQKFGPWKLKDGKLADTDTDLTANRLYAFIHKGIRDDLPCLKEGTMKVTVTGYVKLSDDQGAVRLDDPITYQLEIIDKPDDK